MVFTTVRRLYLSGLGIGGSERAKVKHLFRCVALLAKCAQTEGIVALGEPSARGVADEVAVVIGGGREAECAGQEQLAGSGLQKVCSADDFGNLHGCIVHYYSELIGGDIISTPNHKVSEIVSRDIGVWSEVEVVEAEGLSVRDAEAPVHTLWFVIVRGFGEPVSAVAGVKRLIVTLVGGRGR